jgi:hypothetical protein
MGSPYRRPSWLRRQAKQHPAMLLVGTFCAVVVVVVIVAVSGLLTLGLHPASTPAPTPPNLNPFDEQITAVWGNVVYTGSESGYFAALQHQDLCGAVCNVLRLIPALSTPTFGMLFFFNVTNTEANGQNLSEPQLGISGDDPTVFNLETLCCYSTESQPYSEPLTVGLHFSGSGNDGATIGLEGFVYTTATIPQSDTGSYVLYLNVTSLSSP